jgi:hypothetical protein
MTSKPKPKPRAATVHKDIKAPTPSKPIPRTAKPAARAAKKPGRKPPTKPDTKQSQVIALLSAANGACLADLTTATGWQAHSVRGVISGVLRKKLGLKVDTAMVDGTRRYRIAA